MESPKSPICSMDEMIHAAVTGKYVPTRWKQKYTTKLVDAEEFETERELVTA